MLLSNFACTLFYAMSYPYIYAETLQAVTRNYITFEQIIGCVGVVIFGTLWNRYGDRLFKYYRVIITTEIVANLFLFAHVLITGNLKFYFVLNVLIYAIITKNMACGGIKMRAKVNPTDVLREAYDNNSNTVYSIATLLGATVSLVHQFPLKILFVLAMIGGIIDNFFYLYIYNKISKEIM